MIAFTGVTNVTSQNIGPATRIQNTTAWTFDGTATARQTGAAAPGVFTAGAFKLVDRLIDIYDNGIFKTGNSNNYINNNPSPGSDLGQSVIVSHVAGHSSTSAIQGGSNLFDLEAAGGGAVAGAQTLGTITAGVNAAIEQAEVDYDNETQSLYAEALADRFAPGGNAAGGGKSANLDLDPPDPDFFIRERSWTPQGWAQSSEANRSIAGRYAFDISSLTNSSEDKEVLAGYTRLVQNGLDQMIAGSSSLGSLKTRLDDQFDFVRGLLRNAISRGVGQLADADLDAESARLQALQVQQKLGIEALSIANGNAQDLLQLLN